MPQAHSDKTLAPSNPSSDHGLVRGIGLWHATALNMIDMIGVGPFVTIPLMVATMHGPQAMVGWILGALLVVCDGLVWAELGAALPQAGGPVRYLRAMYGPRVGGWLAFLFVFQLTFSAPLSMASGCIGFAQYAEYLWPALHNTITVAANSPVPSRDRHDLPGLHDYQRNVPGHGHRGHGCRPSLPAHHDHRKTRRRFCGSAWSERRWRSSSAA